MLTPALTQANDAWQKKRLAACREPACRHPVTTEEDCDTCGASGWVDEHDEDPRKPPGSMLICPDCKGRGVYRVCRGCGVMQ